MLPGEVLAAARDAVSAAKLGTGTAANSMERESAHETVSILVKHVLQRHGLRPLRCDVGREWMRQRAKRIYDRECFRRERATGLRASAELHTRWAAEDADSDSDGSGPDAVWYAAAGQPAPEPERQPSAAAIAERLQLTPKQSDALALALDSAQRVTAALPGAARKAAADARAQLRKRYPEPDALRWALRPERACIAAIERCKRTAARRWQPLGPERPVTIPERCPDGSYAARPLALPERTHQTPAPAPAPDRGSCPAAVYPSRERASAARVLAYIAAHEQPDARSPRTGPGNRGPRPHRAAPGLTAGGLGALAAEPTRQPSGWQRTYPIGAVSHPAPGQLISTRQPTRAGVLVTDLAAYAARAAQRPQLKVWQG
jgi:hypothetical protein